MNHKPSSLSYKKRYLGFCRKRRAELDWEDVTFNALSNVACDIFFTLQTATDSPFCSGSLQGLLYLAKIDSGTNCSTPPTKRHVSELMCTANTANFQLHWCLRESRYSSQKNLTVAAPSICILNGSEKPRLPPKFPIQTDLTHP